MADFPQKNYTLGRGTLHFDKFAPGTKVGTGFLYLGNSPEINLSSESENLEHFDSDHGVRQKDDSVLLQLARNGSFLLDHVSPDNMALFFLGTASKVAVSSATGATSTLTDVLKGRSYQIGATTAAPAGVRNVSAVAVTVAAVAKVLNTDYSLDAASGRITILSTGSIADGDDVLVTYDLAATSYNRVVTAANAEIEGALLYVADNPKGRNFDYYWPDVTLKPDGDFALKGDDWQVMGFSFEALKRDDLTEVLYINGRAGDGV